MKIWTGIFFIAYTFVVSAVLTISAGCTPAPRTQALFTRGELITYSRLAVIGLTPEQEQIFMACYTKAFPGQVITFVERKRLQEIINEQDLLKGRLNERTRATGLAERKTERKNQSQNKGAFRRRSSHYVYVL